MKRLYLLGMGAYLASGFASAQDVATEKQADVTPWFGDYYGELDGPQLAEDDDTYELYHYLTLGYKITDDWKTSLVFQANNNVAIGSKEAEEVFSLADSYLKVNTPNVYKNDIIAVSPQIRYYAPTSEDSQDKKSLGKVNPRLYTKATFGDASFTYVFSPSYTFYSEETDGNTTFSHAHSADSAYSINENFAVNLTFEAVWSHQVGKNDPSYSQVIAYPGFTSSFKVAGKSASVGGYLNVAAAEPELKSTGVNLFLSYTFL